MKFGRRASLLTKVNNFTYPDAIWLKEILPKEILPKEKKLQKETENDDKNKRLVCEVQILLLTLHAWCPKLLQECFFVLVSK